MADYYLAVFVIGLSLTVIAFLTGMAGHSLGRGGHFGHGGHGGHFGHGTHGGHGAHAGRGCGPHAAGKGVPLINFGTVTAFMTWFGGIGYLLTTYSHAIIIATVGIAVAGGVTGAGIIFLFMAKVLAPDTIPLDPADYHLPGTLGRVTVTIPPEGTGEVVYTQGGTRKTLAARAADGQGTPRGAEVVVLRYDQGIAYVRPWEQMAEAHPGDEFGGEGGHGFPAEGCAARGRAGVQPL